MNPNLQQLARRFTMSIWALVEVGGLLLGAATVAGFLSRLWWMFELASHFRMHLAIGLAGLAAVWALKRRWRMASICGLSAAVNAVLVLLVLLPAEMPGPQTGTRLRLVSLNVHTENQRSDLVLKFLQTADADVILLMEVNETWMNALQPLRANYPQVIAKPREDNFGIALFSRLPLTNSEVIELCKAEVPSIATIISVGGQPVFLLGTHPLPPGSAEYARLRNEQLQEIAALIRSKRMAAIVLGDLNCTPWSPYFTDLLRDSGLKNVLRDAACSVRGQLGCRLREFPSIMALSRRPSGSLINGWGRWWAAIIYLWSSNFKFRPKTSLIFCRIISRQGWHKTAALLTVRNGVRNCINVLCFRPVIQTWLLPVLPWVA